MDRSHSSGTLCGALFHHGETPLKERTLLVQVIVIIYYHTIYDNANKYFVAYLAREISLSCNFSILLENFDIKFTFAQMWTCLLYEATTFVIWPFRKTNLSRLYKVKKKNKQGYHLHVNFSFCYTKIREEMKSLIRLFPLRCL